MSSMGLGGWKTRITTTMKSNNRMNALLNDSMGLLSLGKKKNISRLKEMLAETQSVGSSNDSKDEMATIIISRRPNIEKVRKILEETISEQLEEEKFFRTYNSQISPKFCQILCREIRTKIKLLKNDRFRVVCFASIIEKLQQTVNYKMSFAMDQNLDNFASYLYEGATYYIIATAFLVYKD